MIEQILQADRLLQVDRVEPARDMYQRVVELDPGNAIARVGLARCALAASDDHGAHQLAAEALAIDPENDMARRMEARLAEILAVRGEPVERPAAIHASGARAMRPMVTEAAPDGAAATPVATDLEAPATARRTDPPPPDTAGVTVTVPEPVPPSATLSPGNGRSLLDRLLGR